MPAEAAQLEMADLNDWFGNFNGESIGHEQGPADVLAEEFQPAEDVDVAPNGGEVEAGCRGQNSRGWISGGCGGIYWKILLGLPLWGLGGGPGALCRAVKAPAHARGVG